MRHTRAEIVAGLMILFSSSIVHAEGSYLRAGIAYDWSADATFTDKDRTATNPPALFGAAAGNDGREIAARGDFGSGPALDAAVGTRLTPAFRVELAASWRPDLAFTGQANFAGVAANQPVRGDASSVSGMVVLYADLAPLAGLELGGFKPFIGAGAGVAYNSLSKMTYRFPTISPQRATITPSGGTESFAWMATVGTGYGLSEGVTVDVAYRYTDLGRIQTDVDTGTVVTGGGAIIPLRLASTHADLRTHGVSLSIRREF